MVEESGTVPTTLPDGAGPLGALTLTATAPPGYFVANCYTFSGVVGDVEVADLWPQVPVLSGDPALPESVSVTWTNYSNDTEVSARLLALCAERPT